MTLAQVQIRSAAAEDAEVLAEIRVKAMRPSLEAVGRFDPVRARDRFLNSFRPADTKLIHINEEIVGFFVVRTYFDHLYLDHLYVSSAYQGRGIGRQIVDDLKTEARQAGLPIRLMALNGSPANDFYISCGFGFVSNDALDTVYEWLPET